MTNLFAKRLCGTSGTWIILWNLSLKPWNLILWNLGTCKSGTFMCNLGKPGSRFRAAAPNHPEALLEEPQAWGKTKQISPVIPKGWFCDPQPCRNIPKPLSLKQHLPNIISLSPTAQPKTALLQLAKQLPGHNQMYAAQAVAWLWAASGPEQKSLVWNNPHLNHTDQVWINSIVSMWI